MNSEELQNIKNLIASDETKEAIQVLNGKVGIKCIYLKTKVLLLSARISRLQNEKIKGIISTERYDLSRNKINNDILLLIEQLETGRKFKLIKGVLSFLALLLGGILMISFLITKEKVFISSPRISNDLISYDIIFNGDTSITYSFFFKINEKDTSDYKLERGMRIVEVTRKDKILSRPYELKRETYRAKQKVNIEFPKRGRYYLLIPFSKTSKKVNTNFYKLVVSKLKSATEVYWQPLKFYHFLIQRNVKIVLGLCFLVSVFMIASVKILI